MSKEPTMQQGVESWTGELAEHQRRRRSLARSPDDPEFGGVIGTERDLK